MACTAYDVIELEFCQYLELKELSLREARHLLFQKWFHQQLLNFRALIECHMDAGGRSNAAQIAAAAAIFIKQNVPTLYKTVFGLMVRHQLVETTKFHKDIKSSPELNMYYKICRLKL